MLSLYCRTQNTLFRFYLPVEDLFTLTSNKFRMVYKVDGNPQLDPRDWSMYSNILKVTPTSFTKSARCHISAQFFVRMYVLG